MEPMEPKFVVFDTETTGLFDFKLPADDPSQPRLASVAFIITDEDGQTIEAAKHYIKPDGWEMSPETTAINGLTTEFLAEHGAPITEVLDLYTGYIESGLIVAAFNAQFDCKVMRAELRRAGRPDLFEDTRNTCVMRGLKPYKDQGLAIKGGQFVKLDAACDFFGIINAEAHDAMGDAEAAREILMRLIADGNVIEPKVHYAKNPPVKTEPVTTDHEASGI